MYREIHCMEIIGLLNMCLAEMQYNTELTTILTDIVNKIMIEIVKLHDYAHAIHGSFNFVVKLFINFSV